MSHVNFRAEIEEYTNRVLGVIKEKYGFKDKSKALDWFACRYGSEFVEKDATDEYAKKILSICNDYEKKSKKKKMSLSELNSLCEVH